MWWTSEGATFLNTLSQLKVFVIAVVLFNSGIPLLPGQAEKQVFSLLQNAKYRNCSPADTSLLLMPTIWIIIRHPSSWPLCSLGPASCQALVVTETPSWETHLYSLASQFFHFLTSYRIFFHFTIATLSQMLSLQKSWFITSRFLTAFFGPFPATCSPSLTVLTFDPTETVNPLTLFMDRMSVSPPLHSIAGTPPFPPCDGIRKQSLGEVIRMKWGQEMSPHKWISALRRIRTEFAFSALHLVRTDIFILLSLPIYWSGN